MLKDILLFGLLLGLVGCGTAPTVNSSSGSSEHQKKATARTTPTLKVNDEIDYASIQRLLGLDHDVRKLGYSEKKFNTCEVGFGYSKTDNCRQQVFLVANFRVLCRDSEGTVSTILTEDDLRPVSREDIHWFLKNADGLVRTDGDGYGQIILASTISQKNQRLRLSNGKDFLLLRANDVRQLIVPKNWCTN